MKQDGAADIAGAGFAIYPKMDCPHLTPELANNIKDFLSGIDKSLKETTCETCGDKSQNWVCLECHKIFCSRYVKQHMVIHSCETSHKIGLSFSDGSYWCYPCESYIDSLSLRPARKVLTDIKIKQQSQAQASSENKDSEGKDKEQLTVLEKMFKFLNVKDQPTEFKKITLDEIVDKMKKKQYKKVVILSGAGLSVAAGIPDFRSPGTGLYSKLEKYKLPYPEAIFEINYYKKNPEAFLTLSKQLLTSNFEPTLGHTFIKKLNDEGMLFMNMTQNIDDLELRAGLPEDKLLQAHGHSRSAHCTACKKEQDITKWKELAAKVEPMYCECEGIVKPDIIFFGEQLPEKFFTAPKLVAEADLVFIIGTSLKVAPFSYLATLIGKDTPTVLINREDVIPDRDYKLFLEGDIQEHIKDLMSRLGWK